MQHTFRSYMRFYGEFFNGSWDNLGPVDYGAILIVIAAGGYLLMRNSVK